MPKLFRVGRYVVYFWSNENGEPIHVHIAEVTPTAGATKIWLTKAGGCIVANNNSRIPQKDLTRLLEMISAQFFMIYAAWKEHFVKNLIFSADESTRKGAFIICFYIPIERKVRLRKQLKTVLVKKFHGTASG